MSMKVTGTVHKVFETKQVTASFSKREFVVELTDKNPKYNQLVMFELAGDKASLLDTVSAGDTVDVEFNLRGREWRSPNGEVKYFNTLSAWRLDVTGKGAVAPSGADDTDSIPF